MPKASPWGLVPYLATDWFLRQNTRVQQSKSTIWLIHPIRTYQLTLAQTPLQLHPPCPPWCWEFGVWVCPVLISRGQPPFRTWINSEYRSRHCCTSVHVWLCTSLLQLAGRIALGTPASRDEASTGHISSCPMTQLCGIWLSSSGGNQ